MAWITIELSDEVLSRLSDQARSLGMTTEALVQMVVDDFLSQPDEEFEELLDYVLRKNAELYRRLAR